MAMQTFALTPGRINKFKGEILSHAVPLECLGRGGRQVKMPKNSSDTYVARRFLPYGATATNANSQNRFFQNGTGARDTAITQAHLTSEGVTPSPESITPVDITVVMQQYSCLYGFTDKTYDLYEDDIPKAMVEQVGERMTFVNEMIIYGALRASTNQYYGGTGTPMPNEIGKVERFRFITSPDLPAVQDGGAAVGATGLYSTTGTSIDVYPFIVTAQDAWSQIALRGKESMDPTFIPPGAKSKSDPFGQRGYAGSIWWKAVMIENAGWMAVGNVGSKTLS